MDKASGKQHLQFTAEIWTIYMNLPPSVKKEKFQIITDDEFPFLDMKISWSPEGGGFNLEYSGKMYSN